MFFRPFSLLQIIALSLAFIHSSQSLANQLLVEQFFEVATSGDLEKMKNMLVSDKSLIYARGKFGFTVLHQIATEDLPELQEYLLKAGADPDAENDFGDTPLHITSHPSFAILLVRYGAKINHITKNGDTPLHTHAAEPDGNAMIKFLLDNGADIAIRNKRGESARDIARSREDSHKLTIFDNSKIK